MDDKCCEVGCGALAVVQTGTWPFCLKHARGYSIVLDARGWGSGPWGTAAAIDPDVIEALRYPPLEQAEVRFREVLKELGAAHKRIALGEYGTPGVSD